MDSILFGVLLTLFIFIISNSLYKKYKLSILNPVLLSVILIIIILNILDIEYDVYNKGGSLISFFIGPATVGLIVSLYNNLEILKKNFLAIIVSIILGSIAGMISIILLGNIFSLDMDIIISLIPKSVTSAIAMDISASIGGIPAVTIAFVVITGVFGSSIALNIFKIFNIKDPISQGLALGTSAHAIGTSKAGEIDNSAVAMSSLAIILTGIFTVILAPIIIKIL